MKNADAAWLAGLLEGEGCFDWNGSSNRYPRIRVEMRDEDVVQRVKALCGGGGAVRRVERRQGHHTTFRFQLCDRERLKIVLTAILPYMGNRRSEKIQELLEAI